MTRQQSYFSVNTSFLLIATLLCMWLSIVLEHSICSVCTYPVHPILRKGVWKNMHFCMFLSISASLGLRATTAVHISENVNILDSSTAVLAHFYSSPFFPGGKVGQFLFEPVLSSYSSSDSNSPVTNWVYLVLRCTTDVWDKERAFGRSSSSPWEVMEAFGSLIQTGRMV